MNNDQDCYWTPEWLEGERETRKALAEGEGLTFPDAEGAIHWLLPSFTIKNEEVLK